MAQIAITKLQDGPRNAVFHIVFSGDGSGDLTDEVVIDPATSFDPALPSTPATPIGPACRLCERMDCGQRAFPPIQYPLHVDENVRGRSFYTPAPR